MAETTPILIKKELNLEKGSGIPDKEKVANISIEQCIKIAIEKQQDMLTTNLKQALKSVVGSCNSLGILIEGKISSEITKEIDEGKYDNEIKEEKTETPEEKKPILKKQLDDIQAILAKELAKQKAAEEAKKATEEKPEEEAKEGEKKEEAKEGEKAASKDTKKAASKDTKKEEKKEEPKKK